MKRNSTLLDEKEFQIKKQKISEKNFKQEETSLLLSMVDINILQNIFIQLVDRYKYSTYLKTEEIQKSLTLLLNFCLSCKLFSQISKQTLFPLILNNININLNYKKYLKILFIKQQVKKTSSYTEKEINNILYESSEFGYFDIINTLIKYGANINHLQGFYQRTPLIEAAINGSIKTIKKLIKFKNLNINQQDRVDRTVLILACLKGKENMVNILLSRKDIDINIKDEDGKTALDIAKRNNYQNIIKILENH